MRPAPAEILLDLVLFGARGGRFGVEARQVLACRTVEGDEAPLRVEVLLGLAEAPSSPRARQVLRVGSPSSGLEVSVEGPVEFRSLAAASVHPLPPLLAARTRLHGLRALAVTEAGMLPLVELREQGSAGVTGADGP